MPEKIQEKNLQNFKVEPLAHSHQNHRFFSGQLRVHRGSYFLSFFNNFQFSSVKKSFLPESALFLFFCAYEWRTVADKSEFDDLTIFSQLTQLHVLFMAKVLLWRRLLETWESNT